MPNMSDVAVELNGDNLGSGAIDLFEAPELQPKELNDICMKYFRLLDDSADYRICGEFLKAVEEIGYTFDFYLDAEPYDLRRL